MHRASMFVVVLAGGMLLSSKSSAGFLTDIVCLGAKASPNFWGAVAAVEAAKVAGVLKTQQDCEDAADIIGDLGVPTSTGRICVCRMISWPSAPPPKPICAEAHSVCATGSPLMIGMQMTCDNSADSNVAVVVCRRDNYCCTNFWDEQCVTETRSFYWSDVDAAKASHPGFWGAPVRTAIELDAAVVASTIPCVGPR